MKNRVLFLVVVVISLVFSCKTKNKIADIKPIEQVNYIPYYLKVYEADSLFIVGNYERSYEILDSLFKKFEPIEIQGYYEYSNYVISAVLAGKNKNIKKIAEKAYKDNGGLNCQQMKIVKKIDSIERVIDFSDKEKNIFNSIYNGKIDNDLRALVDQILKEDQSIRGANFKNNEELEKIARIHEGVIKQMFIKHGYPSTKKIGFGDNLTVVFMHTGREFKEDFLLPELLLCLKSGKDSPEVYAAVYDKLFYQTKEKYYYENDNTSFLNGKEIDSVRKSIGLPHKNYNSWRNKVIFDEYKKNEF